MSRFLSQIPSLTLHDARPAAPAPAASAATSAVSAPPPYHDLPSDNARSSEERLGVNLKESFAALLEEQTNIQRLFVTVAARLERTTRIGISHPLYEDWAALRERHRKLHRDSQYNAGNCANFLQTFSNVLLPLSTSDMNYEEKNILLTKFIESIPVHQESARQTSSKFNQLVHDVESFPAKVNGYLAQAVSDETTGFWSSIWQGLKQICAAFWRALTKIFDDIIGAFRSMFERVAKIQCSFAGFFVTVDLFDHGPQSHSPYGSLADSDSGRPWRTIAPQEAIRRDCEDIAHSLRMFEDSWHLVAMAATMLADKVTYAGKLTSIPLACDATLRTVEKVYEPLLECLQAYSVGKAPKW